MHVTVKYKLRYELLAKMVKNGVVPDSLDQVLVMRMKDILRQNKVKHEKIMVDITRNHGFLTSMFLVTIHIVKIEHDLQDITTKILESAKPFLDDIEDIDIIILH